MYIVVCFFSIIFLFATNARLDVWSSGQEFLYGNLVYMVCSIISIRCLRPAGSEPREAMLSNALHHRFKKRNQTHTKNINGEIWTNGSQKFNKYVTRPKFIFMHVKNRLKQKWLTDGMSSPLGFNLFKSILI